MISRMISTLANYEGGMQPVPEATEDEEGKGKKPQKVDTNTTSVVQYLWVTVHLELFKSLIFYSPTFTLCTIKVTTQIFSFGFRNIKITLCI